MTAPSICVVVSAYNRADLVTATIRAIQGQSLENFEAILVDNGSVDDTGDVMREAVGDDPRFTVLRIDDNRGPGRARNVAWRAGTAPVVAFTDDDCAPTPGWLESLDVAMADADIVQGRTETAPYRDGQTPGWFDRGKDVPRWSARYETCNLAVTRELLERLDGFDERFHIAMGEDTDFGLRALDIGARVAFCADALVVHHRWSGTFGEFVRQRRRYAEVVELFKANPAARHLLAGGVVVRGVHLVVWALPFTVVAAVVAGWWWLPAAVIVAWIVRDAWRGRTRPFPFWSRLGQSALRFIGYSVETVYFAAASLRYRTLVI